MQSRSPVIWIHTNGGSNKLSFSRANQDEQEPYLAIQLCQLYNQHIITAKHSVILAGYLAQIALTRYAVALAPGLKDVDKSTMDANQGEEISVVIPCIVGSFSSKCSRLLAGSAK